jgi:type I restriction enzyme M protein
MIFLHPQQPTSKSTFLTYLLKFEEKTVKLEQQLSCSDNVLFEDVGRTKNTPHLMDKCNLYCTGLPTGIFLCCVKPMCYFTREKTEVNNTKNVWFYDMCTNTPNYGKQNFLPKSFEDFVLAYTGGIS